MTRRDGTGWRSRSDERSVQEKVTAAVSVIWRLEMLEPAVIDAAATVYELKGTMFFQNFKKVATIAIPDLLVLRSTSTCSTTKQSPFRPLPTPVHICVVFSSASVQHAQTHVPPRLCSLRVRRRIGIQDTQIMLRSPLNNLNSESRNVAWFPSVKNLDTIG